MTPTLQRPPAPILDEAAPEPITAPAPHRQRAWWRSLFPWRKTAVGAPMGDQHLLIDNRTTEAWVVHLGYKALGTLAPGEQRLVAAAKSGMMTARPLHAPVGTAYLTLFVLPAMRVVAIVFDTAAGHSHYELRAGTSALPPTPSLPRHTPL